MTIEEALEAKFKKLFEVQKVSYDHPGSTQDQDAPGTNEQETLFVEVTIANSRVSDKIFRAKVTGKGHMIAQHSKLPLGYFSKCIDAHPDDTKDVYFYDFEENSRNHHDQVTRSFSFIYFFSTQFDPNLGTITTVDIDIEETL